MLHEQIELARKAIRQMKRSPAKWMLQEYGELQRARGEYKEAKRRLHAAEKRWNELGEQK